VNRVGPARIHDGVAPAALDHLAVDVQPGPAPTVVSGRAIWPKRGVGAREHGRVQKS
jgi:hypothetical protein